MGKTEKLVKIHIDLPGRKDIGGESLWAKPLAGGKYEIRNSPWYAYDIHWGDIVRAESPGARSKPEFKKVVKRSGHKTLRVIFDKKAGMAAILKKLNGLGATYEHAHGRFYAVDIEPSVDYKAVCNFLWSHEQDGQLNYETGTSKKSA